MVRSGHETTDTTSLKDARVEYAIGRGVVAAFLVDPAGVESLLDLPDEELGRLFKRRLWEVIGVATVHNLDLRLIRQEEERLRKRPSSQSKEARTPKLKGAMQSALANSERYSLVQEGKMLRENDFCTAAHFTQKKLSKYVAAGRIFRAEIGPEPYYPAFFLSRIIDGNDLAKVICRLGDTPSWRRWDFFTTPADALGGSTPLQFLALKKVKPVLKAAGEFAKR